MNRNLFSIAFLMGLLAIVWIGVGFIGAQILALMMTAIIGLVYVFGAVELRQFRQDSARLNVALAEIPEQLTDLGEWLERAPPSLQNPVRLRIEGDRIGLPGPALTPYLVGLLVMLGMLGTFLGMVVTLNGAAFSLEGTADLQTIRTALAAPIKGLGLAFGTSVAGVAASAMLGLMSALSRRDRMQTSQRLDTQIATRLRKFSHSHQRQEAYRALSAQAQALPLVVNQLQAMMGQMERTSQQLNERLLNNQDSFHGEVKSIYSDLAASVDHSLRDSLTQSAQVAGQSIQPLIESAMDGMAQESRLMHQRVIDATQSQVDGLCTKFASTADTINQTWNAALANHDRTSTSVITSLGTTLNAFNEKFHHDAGALLTSVANGQTKLLSQQALADEQRQQAWQVALTAVTTALRHEWQQAGEKMHAQQQQICATLATTAQEISQRAHATAGNTLSEVTRLMSLSENLIKTRLESEADWVKQHHGHMEQLATLMRKELVQLRDEEDKRGQAAVERLGDLQTALASHLATLGTALEDPIKRLIETASEAPRAAAEVIGQLRQEMSSGIVRDNELLQERSRIMETLNSLLNAINHASVEQRSVIDALVTSTAQALNETAGQFAARIESEAGKLSDIAAQVTGSAIEVSSLGETFGFAVHTFNASNEKLIGSLQRIEGALDKSMMRSDEQLAYYVAQAREIIDLSTLSQKEIFDELRRLPSQQTHSTQEVS
jgi:hypothetical protein